MAKNLPGEHHPAGSTPKQLLALSLLLDAGIAQIRADSLPPRTNSYCRG